MVDGVFDADPLIDSKAKPIPVIRPADWPSVQGTLGASHATDVTGGMLSKVSGMLDLVQELPQTEILIISGEIPGRLAHALGDNFGRIGTLIGKGEID
jgi:isopentenyl phosphate kinase